MLFIWPLDDHIITRDFYYLSSIYVLGQHAATDYIRRLVATSGAPIKSIADGTVVGVGWDMYSGFFVAIAHAGGWRSFYRHMFGMAAVVVGQRVSQGQIIGHVGNTGYSLGAHLHFDLWNRQKQDSTAFFKNDWWAHDPELYLGQEDDDMGMTPAERKQFNEMQGWITYLNGNIETLVGQIGQLINTDKDYRITQDQVNQLIEMHQSGKHVTQQSGSSEERVKELIRAAKLTV